MKKNIRIIGSLIMTIFFLLIPKVSAETTSPKIEERRIISINGKTVYKLYDNTETGNKDYIGSTAGKIILNIEGKQHIGYCIDFGMAVDVGITETQKLEEYFANVLGQDTAKRLMKKITEYLSFGYGSVGKTTDKYYLATQQLIWEAINDTGFYATEFYVQQRGGNANKLKISNFRWITDKEEKVVLDISEEINAIKQSIDSYYQTPSFCSSQTKLEIEVGETAEYTDNNNVLSQFEVICENGITCEKNENKLKVTAVNEAGSNKITFLKKSETNTDSYVYRKTGKQGVIISSGSLEAVSCQFGINSFKNEKTADIKIIYIVTITIFCVIMSYITYYTNKSLTNIK